MNEVEKKFVNRLKESAEQYTDGAITYYELVNWILTAAAEATETAEYRTSETETKAFDAKDESRD